MSIISAASHSRAKLAVWATKLGIPVPDIFDAARWFVRKKCPYCQLGTTILRKLESLGEQRSRELLEQILEAKRTNNLATLRQITKELDGTD